MDRELPAALARTDDFLRRHLGPSPDDVREMLAVIGVADLDTLIDQTIPAAIRRHAPLDLPPARGEQQVLAHLDALSRQNQVLRSLIGQGYHDCVTPPVILRNILENPGWYTQYTPYQAEIAQGRLEALVNFQTMVADLTGFPLANASLLDEATAAAEAMAMSRALAPGARSVFLVAQDCHPQTLAVVQTRAEPLGITVTPFDPDDAQATHLLTSEVFGVLLQYPGTDGRLRDLAPLCDAAHAAGALVTAACDLLSLTLLRPPGELGADIAVGSTQRFGVPLGYGGPHAAFLATAEAHRRHLPGRIVGLSKDAQGRPAYRLALQTREQHIRRDKATSNICTAQVLLAVMASMYAVYHGPDGLRRIARRVHGLTRVLRGALAHLDRPEARPTDAPCFDTLRVRVPDATSALARALDVGINLRRLDATHVAVALDETCDLGVVEAVVGALVHDPEAGRAAVAATVHAADDAIDPAFARTTPFLTHPIFHRHHGEHELLRYIHRIQSRDLSLTHSMIPLGSCTMKLNATAEMIPISHPGFGRLHPYAPVEQAAGYTQLFEALAAQLAEITGFSAVSLQPNAGSQGEYAGLLAIRAWHHGRGEAHRDVCLIPTSAHGTNPASAVMAGFRVVTVRCDARGDIDLADLTARAAAHADRLGALMITYPSTHGVFEAQIKEICQIVHDHGGQVYMDGANMNAQVGLTRPADMGADVCHLNLHKTFCIPHGGGGPGMGPIGVAAHLAPFLPGHPSPPDVSSPPSPVGPVAAAPFGSPSILPISYAYIALMGPDGLTEATRVAILNANYLAARLAPHYDVVYAGAGGRVAHEFILDCRGFKASAGVSVDDIAKRLMDFGYHAPTMSWPVAGTLMIEPTESESREELDRFCDALIAIREEIAAIESGALHREDNPLRNAPHPATAVCTDAWTHPYSREQAAFPRPWVRDRKFWPAVARVDNAFGDRNLVCTCPPLEAYEEA